MTAMQFLPDWVLTWYWANIFILIPDWLFIMLRPHSLSGGKLARFFTIFNIYAKVDLLFAQYKNKIVFYIYILGFFDILLVMFLISGFETRSSDPYFALIALCREVFVFTKTMVYLMYSYDFILPRWRIPVYIMNAQWALIPVLVVNALFKSITATL